MSGSPPTPEFIRLARAKSQSLTARRESSRSATISANWRPSPPPTKEAPTPPTKPKRDSTPVTASETKDASASSSPSSDAADAEGAPMRTPTTAVAGRTRSPSVSIAVDSSRRRSGSQRGSMHSPRAHRRAKDILRPRSQTINTEALSREPGISKSNGACAPGSNDVATPFLPASPQLSAISSSAPVHSRLLASTGSLPNLREPTKATATRPFSARRKPSASYSSNDDDDDDDEDEDPEFAMSPARMRSNSQTRADMVVEWESEWSPAMQLHESAWLPKAEVDHGSLPPSLFDTSDGGFLVDTGHTQCRCSLADRGDMRLEDIDTYKHVYRDYFFGTPHLLFVGKAQTEHILVVVNVGNEAEGINSFILVIQRDGNARFAVPYADQQQLIWFLHSMEQLKRFKLIQVNERKKVRTLSKHLKSWESKSVIVNFKFGLIYCEDGQGTEDEVYGNRDGSQRFNDFLSLLGERVVLKKHKGYRGGLKQHTGKESIFTRVTFTPDGRMLDAYANRTGGLDDDDSPGFSSEVMWHVSTLLPYSKRNPQQLDRKRHIGNDIVVVLWKERGANDKDALLPPSMFASNFNHVYILVVPWTIRASQVVQYRVQVAYKDGVKPCRPFLPPDGLLSSEEVGPWLLLKCMNAERAAMYAKSFSAKMRRTNQVMIGEFLKVMGIRKEEPTSQKKKKG